MSLPPCRRLSSTSRRSGQEVESQERDAAVRPVCRRGRNGADRHPRPCRRRPEPLRKRRTGRRGGARHRAQLPCVPRHPIRSSLAAAPMRHGRPKPCRPRDTWTRTRRLVGPEPFCSYPDGATVTAEACREGAPPKRGSPRRELSGRSAPFVSALFKYGFCRRSARRVVRARAGPGRWHWASSASPTPRCAPSASRTCTRASSSRSGSQRAAAPTTRTAPRRSSPHTAAVSSACWRAWATRYGPRR